MKSNHNLKVGQKMEFKSFGELNDWAEKHQYQDDEFKCISADPLVFEKVK